MHHRAGGRSRPGWRLQPLLPLVLLVLSIAGGRAAYGSVCEFPSLSSRPRTHTLQTPNVLALGASPRRARRFWLAIVAVLPPLPSYLHLCFIPLFPSRPLTSRAFWRASIRRCANGATVARRPRVAWSPTVALWVPPGFAGGDRPATYASDQGSRPVLTPPIIRVRCAENDCRAQHGASPIELLARTGFSSEPRTSSCPIHVYDRAPPCSPHMRDKSSSPVRLPRATSATDPPSLGLPSMRGVRLGDRVGLAGPRSTPSRRPRSSRRGGRAATHNAPRGCWPHHATLWAERSATASPSSASRAGEQRCAVDRSTDRRTRARLSAMTHLALASGDVVGSPLAVLSKRKGLPSVPPFVRARGCIFSFIFFRPALFTFPSDILTPRLLILSYPRPSFSVSSLSALLLFFVLLFFSALYLSFAYSSFPSFFCLPPFSSATSLRFSSSFLPRLSLLRRR